MREIISLNGTWKLKGTASYVYSPEKAHITGAYFFVIFVGPRKRHRPPVYQGSPKQAHQKGTPHIQPRYKPKKNAPTYSPAMDTRKPRP